MIDLIKECPAISPWMEKASEMSSYLWEKGWAERNAGNLSVDLTDIIEACGAAPEPGETRKLDDVYPDLAGRWFLVTGSGRRFRDLAMDAEQNACILRMSDKGDAYSLVWGGRSPIFRPTSEFPAHLRVHEYLRQTKAAERVVLHTHPTELIALTHLPECKNEAAINQALWSIHPEIKITNPRGVGFVPYEVPGSEALALASAAGFRRNHPVVIWELHGAVAVGEQIMEAFDHIDTLNKGAKIILACRSAGCVPTGLTKEQLAANMKAFGLKD